MAWSSSDRRRRLPRDWRPIRRRILVRDHFTCTKCGDSANQVDHIEPSGPDEDWNLTSLCEKCHGIKSASEGHAARARLKSLLTRPPEQTPGRREPGEATPPPRRGF